MLKGWLERFRDRNAATLTFDYFLERFEYHDKEVKKRAISNFVINFRKSYRLTKRVLTELWFSSTDTFSGKTPSDKIFDQICMFMDDILKSLNEAQDKTIVIQAVHLGWALGLFLGIVEYGLTAPPFSDIEKKKQRKIMDYTAEIKKKMIELDKHIKPEFVAKRFEKIASEHAGGLSEQQQYLIATIAEIFAS